MSKPKFYRHNPSGEVFMRMETKTAANCMDRSPRLVCLNDGIFYSERSTFDTDEADFTEIVDVRLSFTYAVNQRSDVLL